MAYSDLQTRQYTDIVADVTSRFFPRDLIILKDTSGVAMRNLFNQALRKLDDFCYAHRMVELPIVGNYADTNAILIDGVGVKKVTKVYSTKVLQSIYTVYSQIIGSTPFYYSLIRSQDQFIEFLLISQVNNAVNKRFKNKDTGWMLMPDGHILIDPKCYVLDTSVLVQFYPHFKWEGGETAWELYSSEYNFLLNYFEGLVTLREGKSQSELSFTGLDTNATDYMTRGEELMKTALEEYKAGALFKMGKRF